MIRRAELTDLTHVLDLTIEFNNAYYHKPLNMNKTVKLVKSVIEHGVCFVSYEGYIGGFLTEDPFRDANALVEFGWFAKDRSGIKLLDAFVTEGGRLGADEIRMCTMATSPVLADKILMRKGFSLAETQYRLNPQ